MGKQQQPVPVSLLTCPSTLHCLICPPSWPIHHRASLFMLHFNYVAALEVCHVEQREKERKREGRLWGRGQRGCAPRCSPYLSLIINKANRNCFTFDFFAKGIRTVDQRNDPSISLESIRLWVIDTPSGVIDTPSLAFECLL